MAEKKEQVAKPKAKRTTGGIVVKLSPESTASIAKAVEQFESLGLTKRKATALVADELQRLASDLDAVKIFRANVEKQLGIS